MVFLFFCVFNKYMIFSHQYHILDYLLFLHYIVPSSGEGNGNPLQSACLENPMERGAWWAAVHVVAQSQTRLKCLSMHALEKETATHSSVLAWRIPGTGGTWWAAVYGVTQSQTRLK